MEREIKIKDLETKYFSLYEEKFGKDVCEKITYPELRLKVGDWIYCDFFKEANKIKSIKNDNVEFHFTEKNGIKSGVLSFVENRQDVKSHRYATLGEIEVRLNKEIANIENSDIEEITEPGKYTIKYKHIEFGFIGEVNENDNHLHFEIESDDMIFTQSIPMMLVINSKDWCIIDEIESLDIEQFTAIPKYNLDYNDYWTNGEWIQPPTLIKHGDLVDIKADNYPVMLGRYIGKGYGVVELYNYHTGVKYVIGKVMSRGLSSDPRLISDEKLFEFIKD